MPDYDEVIVAGDRLFLKQFYVDHFSYGQVLEDRVLTGEGETVLSEAEAEELLDGIEPILKSLHRQGLSHDNLSPETIVWQMADQKPGLMHFGALRSVIQRVSAPLHSLDFEASVMGCPMQTDWVNLAETTLVLLGDPDWNSLSLHLAQRLRRLLEAPPQSKLPPLKSQRNHQNSIPASPVNSGRQIEFTPHPRHPIAGAQPQPARRWSKTDRRSSRTPIPNRSRSNGNLAQHFSQYIPLRFRGYFQNFPSLRQDPLLWGMGLLIFGLAGLLGYRMLIAQASNPRPTATESIAAFPLPNAASSNADLSNPDNASTNPSAPPLPDELKTQLRSLQVPDSWFAASVDEMLGQSGVSPEDDRWKTNAKQLVQALEKLTPEARQNIGSYRRADFDNWLTQGSSKASPTKPVSSKQIEAQTDEQFFVLLPDRKGKALNPRQLGQIWYAIARQILKSGN
jgi:serine/threonine protein kinase, bacterial